MSARSGKKILLLISSLASFLVPFTVSSLNVALPAIGEDLSLDAVSLGWITTSYLLTAAACILPFGRIADIYGMKKVFLLGNIVFAIGSILAAFSTSGLMIMGARVIQGLGGAMVFSTSVAIVTIVFPPGERGRAIGIITATVYAGLSLGPVLGGFLTQQYGWPSIFLFNVPIALGVTIATLFSLKGEWHPASGTSFDHGGALLYGLMIILAMYGLSVLPSTIGYACIISGVIAAWILDRWEGRQKNPFIDLRIFRSNRIFLFSNLAAMINYSVVFAVGFILSLVLQYNRGLDPQTTGLILLAQPLIQMIVAPASGHLSDSHSPALIATIGMAVTTLGLIILEVSIANAPLSWIIGGLALLGLGYGLFSSPNTNAIMSSVRQDQLGLASGMVSTMRSAGQLISLAIAMMVFSCIIGSVRISQEVYAQLLSSSLVILGIFIILSIIGTGISYVRREKRSLVF